MSARLKIITFGSQTLVYLGPTDITSMIKDFELIGKAGDQVLRCNLDLLIDRAEVDVEVNADAEVENLQEAKRLSEHNLEEHLSGLQKDSK